MTGKGRNGHAQLLTSGRDVEARQDKAGQGVTRRRKDKSPAIWPWGAPMSRQFRTQPGEIPPYLPLFPKIIGDFGAIVFMGSKSGANRITRAVRFSVRSVSRLASMFRKVDFNRPLIIVRVLRFPIARSPPGGEWVLGPDCN